MTTDRRLAGLLCIALLAPACGQTAGTPAPAPTPAAKIDGKVTEASLTTLTLTAEAEARLGIETSSVEESEIGRTRTVGGFVMPAGGSEITVTAPFAGRLEAPAAVASIGSAVTEGTPILLLVPLAASERDARIEAERAVSDAEGRQVMLAKRAERAAQMATDGSGSRRAAEEAQAELTTANATLKATRDRLSLASQGVSASGVIALQAPFAATVRAMHANAGQTVASGTPLFDLVRLQTVWIRVPLYAGDLSDLDRRAAASVDPHGASESSAGRQAPPVMAPPSADAATAGVDVFYALDNRDGSLRPGQRVGVRLPLVGGCRRLAIPYASLLHDAYGGTWVYEARSNHVFVRRRVEISDIVGDRVVLRQGPVAGTRIVTVGAAELFGTEFGVGK